jgi:hypothetical protein
MLGDGPLLVLPSPYGPIALTVEALLAARDLARSIVPDIAL